jgi:membrane fusion protein (multidrug efflux system)
MPCASITLLRALPVIFATALLAACNAPAPPPAAPPPAEVTVVTVQPQAVALTRELPGRTSPFLVAEVRPQVGGIIKSRLFTEGSRVQAGQALYQLDDSIPRADQQTAKAALARAQAALGAAKPKADRWAELVKSGYVSKLDNESTIAALRQAEADVASAQAVLDRGNVILAHARITSPITGRIGKSSVTQGALVTANQAEPLAIVQQLDPIYVDVTQSSAELLELRKQIAAGRLESSTDLPVTVVLEDGTRYAHEGKLTFSDVTVDPGTGSYLLRVAVPNPDDILLPGMYVRAIVGSGTRREAMVVGDDGKAVLRPVRVSRTIGDQWLVEDGLRAGDRVIVEGLQKVRPGGAVQATEAAPAANIAVPAKSPAAATASQAPPAAK